METEAKYVISENTANKILGLESFEGFKRDSIVTKLIIDSYFDTMQRSLGNSGGGFRMRISGDKKKIAFKLRKGFHGSSHVMEEVESEAPGIDFLDIYAYRRDLPAVLRAREFFKDRSVEEVLTIHNHRTSLKFSNPMNTGLIICLDNVSYSGRRGQFSEQELECEFSQGNPEEFHEFVKKLETTYKLFPTKLGKYERAINYVD